MTPPPSTSWRKGLVALALGSALVVSSLSSAASASAQTSDTNAVGDPVVVSSANPSSVNLGQSFTVTNTVTTPYTGDSDGEMVTKVPPGASFKDVKAPLPAGWQLQYSEDGGVTYSPTYTDAAKVTNIKATGASSDKRKQGQLLAPPQQNGVLQIEGGGDGFNPQFYKDQIWVANHHETPQLARWLRCFNRTDGSPCAGFSKNGGKFISPVSGTPFGQGTSTFSTPNESVAFINQSNGRMYVPVQVGGSSGKTAVGWVCGDLNTQTSCGFTEAGQEDHPIVPYPDGDWPSVLVTNVWGRTKTSGVQYMIGKSGKVYCFNMETGALCPRNAQSSVPLNFTYLPAPDQFHLPFAGISGDSLTSPTAKYAWVLSPTSLSAGRLTCVNIDNGNACPVIATKTFAGYSSNSFGIPTPVYGTNGNFQAMCLQTAASNTSPADYQVQWNCYQPDATLVPAAAGKLQATMPPAVAGTIDAPMVGNMLDVNPYNTKTYTARSFQSVPYIVGTRLYMPVGQSWKVPDGVNEARRLPANNQMVCLDYATGAPCAGFDSIPKPLWENLIYTVGEDTPTCLWWQGDKGLLTAFNPESGQLSCDAFAATRFTVTPPDDCSPNSLAGSYYDKVAIDGNFPASSRAAVGVYDKNGKLLKEQVVRAGDSVDISMYPVSGDTSSLEVNVIWYNPTPIVGSRVEAVVSWTQPSSSFCIQFVPKPDCPQDASWTKVVTDAKFTKGAQSSSGTADASVTVNRGADECIAKLQKYINSSQGNTPADYKKEPNPPGMDFPVGAPVYYFFEVWTPGTTWSLGTPDLTDNNATDPPGDDYKPTYVSGDTNNNNKLDPGERWYYRSSLPKALAGVHTNTATLTVPGASNNPQKSQANYNAEPPGIDVVKKTDGIRATKPGDLEVVPGDKVTWTYTVTNTGRSKLTNINLVDDKVGQITCPSTELAPKASMTCTATGTTVEGTYVNQATVTGEDPWGEKVTDKDDNTYSGLTPKIKIVKKINGAGNLDSPSGTRLPTDAGATLNITFEVTNTGNTVLINVNVVDAPLPGLSPQTKATCPKSTLGIGESMTCTATGTAVVGTHDDQATATGTGTFSNGTPLKYSDGRPYPDVTNSSQAGYIARQQLPIIVDPVPENKFGDGYTTLIKDSSTSPQGVIKRRVFCRPFRPSAAGEIAYCKVRITKKGAVKVRVRGYGKVKVTVQITAKPKPQYKGEWTSNTWRRTWILKGNTTL